MTKLSRLEVPALIRDVCALPFVVVVWDDSFTRHEFDGPLSDFPAGDYIRNWTPGWVKEENDEAIHLVTEISPEENTARGAKVIRRCDIADVIRVKLPERRLSARSK